MKIAWWYIHYYVIKRNNDKFGNQQRLLIHPLLKVKIHVYISNTNLLIRRKTMKTRD